MPPFSSSKNNCWKRPPGKRRTFLLKGWAGGADAVRQIGDSLEFPRVVFSQLSQDSSARSGEKLVFPVCPQVQLHGTTTPRFINGVHHVGVQVLGLVKNLRVLTDGVVDSECDYAVSRAGPRFFSMPDLGQKIEGVDYLVLGSDTSMRPKRWISRTGFQCRS